MSLRNAVSWALPNAYMIETVSLAVSAEADLVAAGVLRQPDVARLIAMAPAKPTIVLLRMILLWICGIDVRPQCRTSGITIYLTHTVHLGELLVKRFTSGGPWRYETVMDRRETPPLTSVPAPG